MSRNFESAKRYYLSHYFYYRNERCTVLDIKQEDETAPGWTAVKCRISLPGGEGKWVKGKDLELWSVAEPEEVLA